MMTLSNKLSFYERCQVCCVSENKRIGCKGTVIFYFSVSWLKINLDKFQNFLFFEGGVCHDAIYIYTSEPLVLLLSWSKFSVQNPLTWELLLTFTCFTVLLLRDICPWVKVSFLSVSGELCPGRGPSPLPSWGGPCFSSPPIPSSSLYTPEVFRSLPQHSAHVRTLINQRQASTGGQGQYSVRCPLRRSYISLFWFTWAKKRPRVRHERDETEKERRGGISASFSLLFPPLSALSIRLSVHFQIAYGKRRSFSRIHLGQSTIAICVHHMCKKNFNNEKHYINIYF